MGALLKAGAKIQHFLESQKEFLKKDNVFKKKLVPLPSEIRAKSFLFV